MSQGKERNGWFGQWLAAMYGRPQTLLVYDPGITGMNRDQALAHFQLTWGVRNLAFFLSPPLTVFVRVVRRVDHFPIHITELFIDVGPPIKAMVEFRHGSNVVLGQDSFQVMQERCVVCVGDRWKAVVKTVGGRLARVRAREPHLVSIDNLILELGGSESIKDESVLFIELLPVICIPLLSWIWSGHVFLHFCSVVLGLSEVHAVRDA